MIPRALPPLRPAARRRIAVLVLVAALASALVVAPAAMGDLLTPESGGSPNADAIDSLYKIVLYIAIAIFVLVEGTLLWSLIKYRARRGGPEAAQIHGNTPLELGWTVGAAAILVVITAVTFVYLDDITDPPASGPNGLGQSVEVATIDQPEPPGDGDDAITIGIDGRQFLWRYDYPNGVSDYHELVVPTDTTVLIELTSSDVIHSWWIPKLGGKMDAVPGYTNKLWFKIAEPGDYYGQCGELCGSGHADMRARVRAVPPEQYTAFLERRETELEQAREALAEQRERREQSQSEIQ